MRIFSEHKQWRLSQRELWGKNTIMISIRKWELQSTEIVRWSLSMNTLPIQWAITRTIAKSSKLRRIRVKRRQWVNPIRTLVHILSRDLPSKIKQIRLLKCRNNNNRMWSYKNVQHAIGNSMSKHLKSMSKFVKMCSLRKGRNSIWKNSE
jgi:hypothetical protein